MTQIQEPLQFYNNEPLLIPMNPNLAIMNQMNLPQMMAPPPINIQQLNNSIPVSAPFQPVNNEQNGQNFQNGQNEQNNQNDQKKDESKYIFFNLNFFYYYRKAQKIKT